MSADSDPTNIIGKFSTRHYMVIALRMSAGTSRVWVNEYAVDGMGEVCLHDESFDTDDAALSAFRQHVHAVMLLDNEYGITRG